MSRTSKTTIGTINITTLRDGERTLPLEALKNLSNEDTDEINSNENSFQLTQHCRYYPSDVLQGFGWYLM